MAQWKRIDLEKEKPALPGLINLDVAGSEFVSATFSIGDEFVRIRKESYGCPVVERLVVPHKKVFGVSCERGNTKFSQSFTDQKGAEKFETEMQSHGFETTLLEDSVPIDPTSDDLPF